MGVNNWARCKLVLKYFSEVFCSQQAQSHVSSSFPGPTGWCLGRPTIYNLLLGKVPLGHAGQKKVFASCINRAALSSERSLQLYLHYPFKVSFARTAKISHSATIIAITVKESKISLKGQRPPLLFTKWHKQLHYRLLT